MSKAQIGYIPTDFLTCFFLLLRNSTNVAAQAERPVGSGEGKKEPQTEVWGEKDEIYTSSLTRKLSDK